MKSCCSSSCKDYELWLGLVAFIVGAVFLLELFDVVPEETWSYLWPSILVVTGLKMMIGGGKTDACCDMEACCEMPMSKAEMKASPAPMKKAAAKKPAKKK